MQWLPCAASVHDPAVATARFGHSAVCISGAGSVWGTDLVVVFGGVSYSDGEAALEHHTALADVAVLQPESDTWFAPQVSSATPEGGLPEPRAFHCAAAVDRRMYIFGGHVMSYDPVLNKKRRRFFNDLWCLDTDSWTWRHLSSAPAPGHELPARRDMATLTPTRAGAGTGAASGPCCLLLFGGRLESGRVAGDAWLLDTTTHTWTQLRIPGPTPPPRKMHAAVQVSNRVVIFGGERDAGGLLDDLWTLKGADGSEAAKWTHIKLRPAPSGRFGHAMAAIGSRLALFGGCLDQSGLLSFSRTYVQCNELWVLDMATFSWHRVDSPEGLTPVSGPALDDPHLLQLLQLQADAAAEEQGVAAAGTRPLPGGGGWPAAAGGGGPAGVLPLPLERMCHSLVAAGCEGRLLLLGGRKRDGICDDAWWLLMGPDDRTPVLTAPRPEALAATLGAIQATRAPPAPPPPAGAVAVGPGGGGGVAAPAAAQASSSPSASAAVANPTLLANLLRRSTPPPQAATAAAAAGGGDATPWRQPPHPPHQHPHPQLHYQPPLLQQSPGRPAAGAAAAGVTANDGAGSSLSSSYGSALDAAATSALVPVPAGYPAPGAAPPGYGSAGSRGMASSRSAGSIAPESSAVAATALGAGAAAGGLSPTPTPHQQPQPGGGPVAGRERMADRASLAFNRLTKQVSTLLSKDAAPPPAAAVAASGGGGSGQGQLLASPPGGAGVGILARLLDGSSSRAGTAAAAAPPPQLTMQPPPLPVQQHQQQQTGLGRVASPAAHIAFTRSPHADAHAHHPQLPAAPPLSPDVLAPLDRLRASLGLPPLGAPHAAAAAIAATAAAASSSSPPRRPSIDHHQALAELGQRLAAPDAGSGDGGGDNGAEGSASAVASTAACVSAARAHLAGCGPGRLMLGQLGMVLADCQALIKARTARAWERLEREEQQHAAAAAARQRSGSSGGGGAGNLELAAAALDRSPLSVLLASQSHWLVGVRPGELRLGDVPRLVLSYGELLEEVAAGGKAAEGS